jgi:hypothetical protein
MFLQDVLAGHYAADLHVATCFESNDLADENGSTRAAERALKAAKKHAKYLRFERDGFYPEKET